MDRLLKALEAYRHIDPDGWVALYRQLSAPAGAACVALGVVLLVAGGGALFRVVAVPLGALVATLWAALLAQKFGFSGYAKEVTLGGAAALGAVGLVYPPAVVFFTVGVPTGLFAGNLAGPNDWLVGFAPGLVVGGALGVVFHRPIAAAAASAVGAWAVMLGLLALLPLEVLVDRPVLVVALAAVLAVFGTTYQAYVKPTPDEKRARREASAHEERLAKERAAAEQRWAEYSAKSKRP